MTDGGARWRKVSGKPFYDAAGRFCGYRGTAIDITAQKEAEQALSAIRAQQKERDRSYRTLIANISGAVYRMKMDEEWTDIFISDAVERIWGYSAAECLAKAAPLFATAIHPDDRDMVTQGTKEAIEKREPYAFEYRIRHRDGQPVGSPTAASRSSTKAGSSSISTASSSTSPTACGPKPN
jgi:PAS domain S-box-containing protein